jgi:hypothetical protein
LNRESESTTDPAGLLALHDEKDRLVSDGYHVELVMGVQIVLIGSAVVVAGVFNRFLPGVVLGVIAAGLGIYFWNHSVQQNLRIKRLTRRIEEIEVDRSAVDRGRTDHVL